MLRSFPWLAALAFGASACGSSDSGSDAMATGSEVAAPRGPSGVGQSGAQDFGRFKAILEAGRVPGPDVLDDVGFFAEHKLDYPTPDCGEKVCTHALLGIAGNMITGSTCTLLQLGMNTPLDPATLARPPTDLVVVVDTSGSMKGGPLDTVESGLQAMIPAIRPEDTVSLVAFSDRATVLLDGVPGDETKVVYEGFLSLYASGGTNLYDGLFTALSLAAKKRDQGRQSRVIFVSDGEADSGITDHAKLVSLVASYAKTGIALTSIGLGTAFDVDLMRSLGSQGGGNFYFLDDPASVEQVFSDELATTLFPLALDVTIDVAIADSFRLRGAYGTAGWQGGPNGGTIAIPALYLADRKSAAAPIDGGRRGGGGTIIVETTPQAVTALGPASVGHVTVRWTDPLSGDPKEQDFDLDSPVTPGVTPPNGYFSEHTAEKGFVMLQLFVGFQMAARLAYDADPGGGIAVLDALRPAVEAWLARSPDPDVEDDLKYLDLFLAALRAAESKDPAHTLPPGQRPPSDPWPDGD